MHEPHEIRLGDLRLSGYLLDASVTSSLRTKHVWSTPSRCNHFSDFSVTLFEICLRYRPTRLLPNEPSLIQLHIASSLIWLLWDIIVTFDDEVDLVWSQGLNVATFVFYLNRYGVPMILVVLAYGKYCGYLLIHVVTLHSY